MTVLLLAVGLWSCAGSDPGTDSNGTSTDSEPHTGAGDSGTPDTQPESVLSLVGPRPRNVLILSIDTLRRDKVGRYGGGTLTPFLDGLLTESVVLDDFRACSNWTLSGLLCVYTGETTVDLGFEPVGNRIEGVEWAPGTVVPDDLPGLPQWLHDAGFETRLVSTSRFLSDAQVTGNGFELIVGELDAPAEQVAVWGAEQAGELMAGDAPWFLHVHFRDPHFRWQAPEAYLVGAEDLEQTAYALNTQSGLDQAEDSWDTLAAEEQAAVRAWIGAFYDAEVRYVDAQLAVLWASLEAQGALEDTLVVIFTDHGEQLFDRGSAEHYDDLFDEESAAVGALWARSLVPTAWSGRTGHPDLVPGVFEVLGLGLPDSVTGLVPGTSPASRPRLTFFGPERGNTGPLNTVDLDGLRLRYDWHGELQLFDRVADREELVDLYGTRSSDALEQHLLAEVERNLAYVSWAEPVGLPR